MAAQILAALRLASIRFTSHWLISASIHPTALPPSDIGAGKLPSATRRYMVERESPVRALTVGSLRIVVTMLRLLGRLLNTITYSEPGEPIAIPAA